MKQIGRISANIAGDYRYTEVIEVHLADDGSVTVTITDCSAAGGMDGPGGRTDFQVTFKQTTPANATARQVAMLVRSAIKKATIVERYGKPSKNFTWAGDRKGISMATIQTVLDIA